MMDHNLEAIDLEEPLDGSLLDVSIQEERRNSHVAYVMKVFFFKKQN